MVTKVYETLIGCPVSRVWEFFESGDALKILTPAEQHLEIITPRPGIREGAIQAHRMKQYGIRLYWKTRVDAVRAPFEFVEVGIKTPFKTWTHIHQFVDEQGDTLLRDAITYEPRGIVGRLMDQMLLADAIDDAFKHRHLTAKNMLESVRAVVNVDLIEPTRAYESDFEIAPDVAGTPSAPTDS